MALRRERRGGGSEIRMRTRSAEPPARYQRVGAAVIGIAVLAHAKARIIQRIEAVGANECRSYPDVGLGRQVGQPLSIVGEYVCVERATNTMEWASLHIASLQCLPNTQQTCL